jgi:hypothetical protein
MEERELTARWAALSGRDGPSAATSHAPVVEVVARQAKEVNEQETRRGATTRAADDARHREPRM